MLPFPVSLLPASLRDERVFLAMERVPRELFVPKRWRARAYDDVALSIGFGQTISQPFIVAYMSAGLAITDGSRILEIGTGSGYQTAILAAMGAKVYTTEIIPQLSKRARQVIEELGLGHRVDIRICDGRHGWAGEAPFDGVVCAAASLSIPPAFIEQARIGARIVLPIGPTDNQILRVLVRREDSLEEIGTQPVRFVPLVRAPAEG